MKARLSCRFGILLVLALVVAMPVNMSSQKAGKPDSSKEIEVKGCVQHGVECLVLVTAEGKKYSLTGKNLPTLDKQLVVSVKGTPAEMSMCMEGTALRVKSWSWTKMRCPMEPSKPKKK